MIDLDHDRLDTAIADIVEIAGDAYVIRSDASKRLLAMAKRAARYPNAVLITGESGSGKELIARAVHEYSLRRSKPWVDVNCAALPEHLVESELFGYEKGAFSGADSGKAGFFELAHQGTLFLDEIGELDPRVQAKLLRVLDGAPYYRLGGSRKITVDVRVVAATNRNLEEDARTGRFRGDLFHRLSQIQLFVPPLRERPEDVEALAQRLLQRHDSDFVFSVDAMTRLLAHSWPGNVREVKNVVDRLAIMRESGELVIEASDLPPEIGSATASTVANQQPMGNLDDMERLMIEKALGEASGDQGRAAQALGISRRTLVRKLKAYRESHGPIKSSLGTLRLQPYRYFRADIRFPVSLMSEQGEELQVHATNVSANGMGIEGLNESLRGGGILDVALYLIPDAEPMVGKARITWADAQGKAGLRFLSLESEAQRDLERWLASKIEEEGWSKVQ